VFAPELLVILAIAIIVFGAGRVGELGSALGNGIREFRTATRDDSPSGEAVASAGSPPRLPPCSQCGTIPAAGQKFCGRCGHALTPAPTPT
jgi:sec-independent protein translocase protein TatA